jgi:hypothetical protein
MNTPTFLIESIEDFKSIDLSTLRTKLFEQGVLTKDYEDDGLILIYHKFDSPITSELVRECRSLVLDRSTLKIVSYSCETPLLNGVGSDYLITNSTAFKIINPCYEGTYMSVFYHGSKWYVSTRRCLDSSESRLPQSDQSHFYMFESIIKNAGWTDFNNFTSELSKEYSYYFVLIHHLNKHQIDYSKEFGPSYAKICLTTIRDSELRELDIYTQKVSWATYDTSGHIFVPIKLDSLETFTSENQVIKYNESPETEGVVIRIWNHSQNKFNLIKLQTFNYQFALILGPDQNIFKGLIYLYQNDKLFDYFAQNPNSMGIQHIVNPINTSESFDTVGTIDAVFKVCTVELFELYKLLWSLKTGQQQNKNLYDILPREYRDILFAIKGIYYKKKAFIKQLDKETTPITLEDIRNSHLKTNDIYSLLKSLPTETIIAFIRMRKLMFNWVKLQSDNKPEIELCLFSTIGNSVNKTLGKLCAIFTNKLFPSIMVNEIPPAKPQPQPQPVHKVIADLESIQIN